MKDLKEVFDPEDDLFVETEDRCIPFQLRNKKVVYLNKEQYYLMIEEFLKDKKERYINSRCCISINKEKTFLLNQLNKKQ